MKYIKNISHGKTIEPGDILAVEYIAQIAGTSTPFARGTKEQFVHLDGSLIKGWDVAVASMKVGEHARFHVRSDYAYGKKGINYVIPPDSDVELDIQVLAWLGNQLKPETLFQKDLDIDPYISSTPESINADFQDMQVCMYLLLALQICC